MNSPAEEARKGTVASPKWGLSPAQGLKGRPRGHPSVLWEAARLHMAERSMRYCGGQDPFLEYSSQRHSEVRIVTENTHKTQFWGTGGGGWTRPRVG